MNAIEVTGLTHRYGRMKALDDVSLSVPEGAIFALLGPNGAGKTTLLHAIMGLQRPSAGEIAVFGKDRGTLTLADRAKIGYVAEGQKLPGWMRLRQLEEFLAPLYPTWDHALAADLRTQFHLDPDRKVGSLSRGETMKAAVLVALAPRPKLLVMDEPFTGIDVATKDDLVRGVLLGAGPEGWTVLISSHDVEELESMVDWVAYLERGKIRFARPADELRDSFAATLATPSLREIFIALSRGAEVPAERVAAR